MNSHILAGESELIGSHDRVFIGLRHDPRKGWVYREPREFQVEFERRVPSIETIEPRTFEDVFRRWTLRRGRKETISALEDVEKLIKSLTAIFGLIAAALAALVARL